MAPTTSYQHEVTKLAARTIIVAATSHLSQRDLTVRGAQGVTIGVIAAYVVGIAILWNIPYLHYLLWPFKVSRIPFLQLS